ACSSSSRSPRPERRGAGALKSSMHEGSRSMTSPARDAPPVLRDLGRASYEPTVDAMKAFTAARTPATPDEIWLVEHAPVFTQGLAGKAEHVLDAGAVPIVQTNRGGQVTYHGPGQVVAYPMVDLRRLDDG